MDIETLIYIVVIVVVFIYTVSKKSKPKQQIEEPLEIEPESHDRITAREHSKFQSMFDSADESIPTTDEKKKVKKYDILESIPTEEGEQAIFNTQITDIHDKKNEVKQPENELVRDFDIKKAVIYSEIMKRPELD